MGRRKISKYKYQLTALSFITLLSWYTLGYWPERLFELLMFIVIELQLELAYRQWWLERERSRPHLWVEVKQEGYDLRLYAGNIGFTYAFNVVIFSQICSLEKCYETIVERDRNYDGVIAPGSKVCVGTIQSPGFSLSRTDVDKISIKIDVCYIDALEGSERCEAFVWTSRRGARREAREPGEAREPPGLLTKIPNMIRDCLSS
jgi:hypothetical protein